MALLMGIVQVYDGLEVARVSRPVGAFCNRFHGSGDPCYAKRLHGSGDPCYVAGASRPCSERSKNEGALVCHY